MQLRYFIFVTLFFGLMGIFSYYHFDRVSLALTQQLIDQYPALSILSGFVSNGFRFFIWFFLSFLFLFVDYLRVKNFKKLMRIEGTQFWVGLILSMLFCFVLKVIIGRYRPEMFLSSHLFGLTGFAIENMRQSMPSDHTALIFSMATTISCFWRKKWVYCLAYFVAIFLACARIISFSHYPSDVLVGALVGIWGSYFAYYICIRFRQAT